MKPGQLSALHILGQKHQVERVEFDRNPLEACRRRILEAMMFWEKMRAGLRGPSQEIQFWPLMLYVV